MKVLRRLITCFLAICLAAVIPCRISFAASPDHIEKVTPEFGDAEKGAVSLSKKVLYQTFDKDEDPFKHFEENIVVNGDNYYLEYASTPTLVKTEKVIPDVSVHYTEPFTYSLQGEVIPEEEWEYEGVKLRLVNKTLVQKDYEEETIHQTIKHTYKGIDAAEDIPMQIEAEMADGKVQTVKGNLDYSSHEVLDQYWDDDFTFKIKVTDYDKEVYDLNGTDVKHGEDLNNYKAEFLDMLGLDPEFYIIDNISWDGEPYESGGRVCRNAVTSGSKYKKDVEVIYEGDVTYPSVNGYVWECEYEEVLPENMQNVYTMSTTVTYRLEGADDMNFWQKLWEFVKGVITAVYEYAKEQVESHPVISSAILLAIAAVIIFLLTRQRKRTCKYRDDIRCPHRKPTKEQCSNCIYSHTGQKM